MNMKPAEIAIPHSDVLKGTFQQSEFAADITAVHSGKAPTEYQDAGRFSNALSSPRNAALADPGRPATERKGGRAVIQLQTAFGGGKTHTMLAVCHMAARKYPLAELGGIKTLIEKAGLKDVPQARVAVIDGTDHSPGQAVEAWPNHRENPVGRARMATRRRRRLRPAERR